MKLKFQRKGSCKHLCPLILGIIYAYTNNVKQGCHIKNIDKQSVNNPYIVTSVNNGFHIKESWNAIRENILSKY